IQVSYGLGPQKTLTFLFDVPGNPQHALKDKRVIDNGCSRHMTGNLSYLFDFEEINGGYVSFGGNPKGGFMKPFGCPVTILNTLDPLGKFNGKANERFLVGYSNKDVDTTFEVKEPESAVHASPSSCEKTKKHDDKIKNFSSDSTNGVNAASTPVPDVRPNSTNNTNTFSAAGPSNNAASSNFKLGEKVSYVDPS
nr:ribonuclease H-like domain-containing protein [Tanacetum cinerariifolium]